MPWVAAVGAIAAPIISGAIGSGAAAGDRDAARRSAAAAYEQLAGIGVPEDIAKELILKEFDKNGILTPDLEKDIKVGSSAFQDIKEAPEGREAQLQALQAMQQVGKTGLRPEDMAAMNQLRQQVAQDTEAKRQQIMQNYQQRGLGGGGAELAAQLQASQSGANQASQQGDQLAAQASQRALQALQQQGAMGNQLRGTDFNIAGQKAQAADQFKQFDLQNQMARQQRNVAAQNQAQAANLARQQGVGDTNIQMANAEKQRQLDAQQQLFNDRLALGQAKANALLGQSSNAQAQASQTAQNWANIGSGVSSGLGSLYGGLTKTPATAAHGAKVPGEKLVPGDSEINDTQHYMLSPDEVVLPASIAKSDKLHEIHTFLRNLEASSKGKK